MLDDGRFMVLWQKYAAVIHVLLKNTDTDIQKLQLYKHEFEVSGQKQKANMTFSFNLLNGRAVNIVSTTGIARDLWQVLDSKVATRNLLKERKIKVSVSKTFELQLEKIQEETISEVV
ncbi:MAG: hypothetical protein WCQ95_03195 [Bacteroidota bacterium]